MKAGQLVNGFLWDFANQGELSQLLQKSLQKADDQKNQKKMKVKIN